MQANFDIIPLLALFFVGLSSWLLVSGVFAAAVWVIADSPEGSTLFSHLDVTVQSANLVPAFIVLFTPDGWVGRHCSVVTGALLSLGVATALWLMLAADYKTTDASVGLLVGSAASGILGCASMVTFFPFAFSVAGPLGLTALSTGVGACGVVAQVLSGLSQVGSGFGIKTYFTIVLIVQGLGFLSFCLICATKSIGPEARVATFRLSMQEGTNTAELTNTAEGTNTAGLMRQRSPAAELPRHSQSLPNMGGACCLYAWAVRHLNGIRIAGFSSMIAIAVTAMLEYAMPGLLPYLVVKDDKTALFWQTALWNSCTLPGRLLAGCVLCPQLSLANLAQLVIMAGAVWCSSAGHPPPLLLALPAVSIFSALHGWVVTTSFIAAGRDGSKDGPAYCGLFNQAGAWLGSCLSLAFVALSLEKK